MKLSTAIAKHLHWKQLRGIRFVRGTVVLSSFLRRIGDVELASITPNQISNYLDKSRMAPDTWWRTYQMFRSFFQFWISREEITKLPMPRPRAALPPPFRPYIFSKTELRRLIQDAGRRWPNGPRKYDPITLQSILIFIYGTGALIHEAIEFRVSEIDFEKRMILLRSKNGGRIKTLPISATMANRLSAYLNSTAQRRGLSDFVFLTSEGKQVRRRALLHNFRRLCMRAGIHQEHGVSRIPGMHDLRHTFAVHCLDAWLRKNKDVWQMLPVLSGYMGHVMSRSTEQYLKLVPARFLKQLASLAPTAMYRGRSSSHQSISLASRYREHDQNLQFDPQIWPQ
jgi:integrase/recombinase XerD